MKKRGGIKKYASNVLISEVPLYKKITWSLVSQLIHAMVKFRKQEKKKKRSNMMAKEKCSQFKMIYLPIKTNWTAQWHVSRRIKDARLHIMAQAYLWVTKRYRLQEQMTQMVRSPMYVLNVQILQKQNRKKLSWFNNHNQAASSVYQQLNQE